MQAVLCSVYLLKARRLDGSLSTIKVDMSSRTYHLLVNRLANIFSPGPSWCFPCPVMKTGPYPDSFRWLLL